MNNWFTKNGKVLTNNGKIRGCCCSEPCTDWVASGGTGYLCSYVRWDRTGDDCPSGTLFMNLRYSRDFTWISACNSSSIDLDEPYGETKLYTIWVPEGCNDVWSNYVLLGDKMFIFLHSWSWVAD